MFGKFFGSYFYLFKKKRVRQFFSNFHHMSNNDAQYTFYCVIIIIIIIIIGILNKFLQANKSLFNGYHHSTLLKPHKDIDTLRILLLVASFISILEFHFTQHFQKKFLWSLQHIFLSNK